MCVVVAEVSSVERGSFGMGGRLVLGILGSCLDQTLFQCLHGEF